MFPTLDRETQCKLLENETKQFAEAAIFPPAMAATPAGNHNLDRGKGPFNLVTCRLRAKTNEPPLTMQGYD